MKYLFIATFFFVVMNCQQIEKTKINLDLKKELAQIDRDDQMFRELMQPNVPQDQLERAMKEKNLTKEDVTIRLSNTMNKQDRENLVKIEKIIKKYGYPGKTLVGEPENKTAWLVIQHSPKINQYLPMIKKAAETQELPFMLYAMMLDRQLMQENKEQIYGTQGASFFHTKNGKQETVSLIWPIKDFDNVNKLRKEAGFSETIEDYAKGLFGNEFILKKYTLEEALKLQNQK